jgi:hypothetical protein
MTTTVDVRTSPVTLVRAAAGVLGIYAYLVGQWLEPEPVAVIREWLNRPLGLGEDFGPLAIMLLLACTGYTAAATGFQVRRLVWVCLPAVVATVCAVAANLAGLASWPETGGIPVVPLIWVTGLQVVAWVVALDRQVWPATLVLLAAIGVACLFADDLPVRIGRPLAFLPLVLVGHLAWRVLDGKLPAWLGVLLGAGCFAAIIGVERSFPGLAPWWYPVAATYAVLLFLVAVRPGPVADTVNAHPVTRGFSAAAEWLILVGPVVGVALMNL